MRAIEQITRIDWRVVPVVLGLMLFGLLVISSCTGGVCPETGEEIWLSQSTLNQLQGYFLGWVLFFFFACFDYHRLREWTWFFYGAVLLCLIGLFFTDPIARVHRWFRVPLIGVSIQPSEYAKLAVVLALSWFLEKRSQRAGDFSTAVMSCLIVGIPFLLILKQPDLGTALVLVPITLVIFYYGNIHARLLKFALSVGACALIFFTLLFTGVISHENLRPYATRFMKEYQYDRLSPDVHHQKASTTAIALGGMTGTGWRKGEYTAEGWLPTPYTDSVFSVIGEEFGLIGLLAVMGLYYALAYLCFQVSTVAKDSFGRLLSAGMSVYIVMHVLVNMGMMSGLLPITGVPLLLITYGRSSILATMCALGILQNIYTRRFMF